MRPRSVRFSGHANKHACPRPHVARPNGPAEPPRSASPDEVSLATSGNPVDVPAGTDWLANGTPDSLLESDNLRFAGSKPCDGKSSRLSTGESLTALSTATTAPRFGDGTGLVAADLRLSAIDGAMFGSRSLDARNKTTMNNEAAIATTTGSQTQWAGFFDRTRDCRNADRRCYQVG